MNDNITKTIDSIQETLFFLRRRNQKREIYNIISSLFISFEKKLLKAILSNIPPSISYDMMIKNEEAHNLYEKFCKENNISEEELSWIELLKKKEVVLNIDYTPLENNILSTETLSKIIILPEDDIEDKISKMKLICLYDKIMNE